MRKVNGCSARHRLVVMEKAVPEPVRPKEPAPSVTQFAPPPPVPQVRTPNEEQRSALLEALVLMR